VPGVCAQNVAPHRSITIDEEPVRFYSDFHSAPEGRNMPAPQLLDVLVEAQIIAQTLQSIHISHLIPDHTPHATKNKN